MLLAVEKAQSLQLQLSAAEEASERNAAKYRTELLHHSEDMQALSKAKEAEARAIAARFPGINYLPPGASLAQACETIVNAVRQRDGPLSSSRKHKT